MHHVAGIEEILVGKIEGQIDVGPDQMLAPTESPATVPLSGCVGSR